MKNKFKHLFYALAGCLTLALAITLQSCGDDEEEPSELAIASFSPASGAVGTTVEINGQNFSTNTEHNTVKFNGVVVTEFISAEPSKLTVKVPQGATLGKISVTVTENGKTETKTSVDNFDVTGLSITGFTPTEGYGSPDITITGQEFGENVSVWFAFANDPDLETLTEGVVITSSINRVIVENPTTLGYPDTQIAIFLKFGDDPLVQVPGFYTILEFQTRISKWY